MPYGVLTARENLDSGLFDHDAKNSKGPDSSIFKCVRKISNSDYYLRHVCLSVCPNVRLTVRPH
jgi:hypothetical protein